MNLPFQSDEHEKPPNTLNADTFRTLSHQINYFSNHTIQLNKSIKT